MRVHINLWLSHVHTNHSVTSLDIKENNRKVGRKVMNTNERSDAHLPDSGASQRGEAQRLP